MRTRLHTPRDVLSSLLSTLTTPSAQSHINQPASTNPAHPPTQAINPPYDPPTNPLKTLPPSYRALLSTLHVLLPTGVLLQALDLLDRGLVLMVIEETQVLEAGGGEVGMIIPPQAGVHLDKSSSQAAWDRQGQGQAQARAVRGSDVIRHEITSLQESANEGESQPVNRQDQMSSGEGKRNRVYQVRSSQAPKSRFKDNSVSNLTYTVRLEAWNCSCAAFAFESFPGGSYSSPWTDAAVSSDDEDAAAAAGGEGRWEFGGLSSDGKEGGHVPVCKHLLACLLAERWESVLGGYVRESVVEREEMAGLVGGS